MGGGGLLGFWASDKHLPQSPSQVNFFRWRHFSLLSWVFSFYGFGKISRTSTVHILGPDHPLVKHPSPSGWSPRTHREGSRRDEHGEGAKKFRISVSLYAKMNGAPYEKPLETVDYVFCPQKNNLGTIRISGALFYYSTNRPLKIAGTLMLR